MSDEEEKVRDRLLVRLRKHFALRRSPRATMSAILMATGIAGCDAEIRTWLLTAVSLMAGGIVFQKIAPGAKSIGGVWRHYHPAPVPAVPQLEREG